MASSDGPTNPEFSRKASMHSASVIPICDICLALGGHHHKWCLDPILPHITGRGCVVGSRVLAPH